MKNELFDDKPAKADKTKPPEALDQLAGLVDHMAKRNRPRPAGMPENKYEAARWWIELIENPKPWDRPEALTRDEKIIGWKTPYHDRLIYLLKTFYSMTRVQQQWIIDAIGNGIPWRGDTQEQFSRIITAHNHIQENPELIGRAGQVLAVMRKGESKIFKSTNQG